MRFSSGEAATGEEDCAGTARLVVQASPVALPAEPLVDSGSGFPNSGIWESEGNCGGEFE